MSDEEGGDDDVEDAEAELDGMDDMEMGDAEDDMEDEMESIEYDIEEAVEEDDVVEEATKLSDNVAEPKGGESDASNSKSPLSQKPKATKVEGAGEPVKINDGGDGNSGDNSPKDHTPSDNIKVDPKKA